ncbi:MAG: glycosyltransferase family 2 protein [Paludibacteraceae bacterium]|nr:glycosyltransferase family 2 protein [Paludibacteraceae bacterium]
MIRLGIVSPCYNEHDVLAQSASRLTALFNDLIAKGKITKDSFVLFVNDGSQDDTWEIISSLYATNPIVNGLNLAHNVGHQYALMAGMMNAKDRCDGVVTVDCDLQDDITAIEKMIDLYEAGNDIVYGVKVSREGDSLMKRCSAQTFYRLQSSMGVNAVYNHADFRFMSRRALEALSQYPERNLYLRGMIPTIGFRTATVDDTISERTAGKSKYTLSKMLRLASDGITSFSSQPMTIVLVLGVLMLVVALGMGVYVLVSLLTGHYVPGWSSLMLSMWFIGAVITIGIGICGAYIGKMYIEVKHRPLYIVADQLLHD